MCFHVFETQKFLTTGTRLLKSFLSVIVANSIAAAARKEHLTVIIP